MNCRISYIDKENISETEKQRLFSIHTNIFSKAKESGDFRNFDGKLYTLKEGYNKGISFVAGINKEYSTPVAKINTKAPGQHYLSVNVLPLATTKQEVLFQKSNVPITAISSLRTFDFGSLEGQPQTAAKNKAIHNNIINIPDELMSEEGETFNQAERRVINELKDIVKTAPNNTLVVTHNSVFGVIKLWDSEGRPDEFNREQRIKYTEQDNKFHTGEHFTIKGDNGTIYIARHGATEDNEKGVFRTKNAKLSPEGIEQAEKLGDDLKDVQISKVIASPLPRTLTTSNIVLSKQQLPKEATGQSIATEETLKKVKEVLNKIGVDVQDLTKYAKTVNLDSAGINAVANLSANIIAIAEGKESQALTEETVHIATSILEQTNPKMVTEMIAKIDRFKIYKQTLDAYKTDRNYQLPDGKPDIRKIKKEAVDKLIAEVIINNNADIEQYPELREEINQSLVKGWWNSILQWIKSLYTKANIDIFKQAASDILTKDIGTTEDIKTEGTFYQLSDKQKDIQQKLANTQNKIEKVVEDSKTSDPLLLDSEEANNFYRVQKEDGTWEKVTKRVTDRVKAWYKQRFGNKVFTAQEKEFNELKRKYGVEGHADFEEIHTRYYNEDGTKRDIPLEKPSKFNLPSQEMYNKLEKYYVGLVNTFPKDTLIFSEVIIYDEKQKEAGTIDFLAIEPSGKTSIFDWKFMNFGKNQEDVAWYKQGAYNVQIGRYKEILNKEYGIKEFGQLRAIPITMNFENKDKKDKKSPLQLKSIGIGSVNPTSMEPLTQLPIAEESESTGNEALDNIIKRLNAHFRQVSKEKTTNEEDKQFKIERLNILNKAIRHAHITHNVVPLIQVIEVMRKEGDKILDDYNLSYKNRPATLADSTNQELSDFAEEMRDYIKLSDVFTDIGDDLGELIYSEEDKKENPTEAEKQDAVLRRQYLDMLEKESRLIRKSQKEIKKAALSFADKHIGERNLVTGLLKPEKVLKGLGTIFRGVSELPSRSINILVKLTRDAQGKASTEALKEVTTLDNIRKKLKDKGGDLKKLEQQLYQKDKEGKLVNKLILKYDSKFYSEMDEKALEGGNLKWLKDNVNIEEYKKEAKSVLDRQIDRINRERYNGSPEEEELIRDAEKLRFKRLYDIDREDFNGWNNYILKSHPLDKWYTEEYKNVLKDEDLLELYDFIIKINKKAKNIGYLENKVASNFLPFVRKSMAEQLSFDGPTSILDTFQKSLQINIDDVGYGKINEVTGELENGIPKYYTHDFTKTDGINDYSQVSEELFKNLIVYIQQVEKYKYMSEIEGQLKLVKMIEEFKGHLNTSKVGNVIIKDGKPEVLGEGLSGGNAENTKIFDDFLRVMLYDQRYVLSDSDTPLHLDKVLNFVKKSVNNVAGKEVWKESDKPTATSLIKTIDAANRGFQLKTLGFEFISGAVNWFGSNLQIATQAGNYFKSREFAKNEAKLTFQKFANEEDKELFIQLVDTFMPLKDDPSYELYKQAGLTKLTRLNLGDELMVFMRKPEQLVEKAIFLSLLENTMVVDGKLVSIREFVKNKYKDRYNSADSYNQVKDKIEQEIEELKKTSSIDATKKLEDGKLVIPGLNLNDRNEIQRLTNLSRKLSENATGAMTKENINRMSMSIWTKSMMIFKNWIPKLADTRFSEFRKVSDDFSVRVNEDGIAEGEKYDIGRIRLLAYILSDGIFKGVANLKNIIYLNSQGLARLDELFENFKQKYESETGETLNMSREDFIDLIRTNLRNQLKELAIFASLIGMALSLGFMAPDDDEDKATKNFFRYSQKVLDKFVNELSFFYNPADWESLLSGGIFPAVGIIEDMQKFIVHFFQQTTGLDFDPNTSYDDVRKKAQPIKHAMRMLPITKSAVTYLAIFNEDFAKEFDVTVSSSSKRH